MAYIPPHKRILMGERSVDRQHQPVDFEKTNDESASTYGGGQFGALFGNQEREHHFWGVPFLLGMCGQNNVWCSDFLTIEVQPIRVTSVHTLLNCAWGKKFADIGSIQFNFNDGSHHTEQIIVGKNVRDTFEGGFHNYVTDAFVTEVMSPSEPHWARLDMQTWFIPREFHGVELVSIAITSTGGNPSGKMKLFALTLTGL
jgi:hypothetical protein